MGERRRAAVSDCRCNKAPSGYTCPGCWWSQGCGKNKCIRSCRKKMKKIIGFWEPLANNVGSHKFSTTYGTRVTDRVVTTTQISKWSETTTSFGVSVMGKVAGIELGSTMDVSRTTGQSMTKTYTKDFSTTWSKSRTRTWDSSSVKQGQFLWRWQMNSYNSCNGKMAETEVWEFEETENRAKAPCCLPGGFKKEGSKKMYHCCVPGYDIYKPGQVSYCGCNPGRKAIVVSNSHRYCNGIFIRQSRNSYMNPMKIIGWRHYIVYLSWKKPWWRCTLNGGGTYGLWYSLSDRVAFSTKNYCSHNRRRWKHCPRASMKVKN